MIYRQYGNTGIKLSAIGFGGIIVMDETPGTAADYVSEAVDRGVNYFDVAPSYGNAEDRLGPALKPHRHGVFLACKTTQRTAEGAGRELAESLKKMETDHFDLYQFHAMTTQEDFDTVMGPGGAMEAVLKAKEEGLIRHIGFSAHSQGIAIKLLDVFPFDSVLFPFNFVTWNNGNFGPEVMGAAKARGAARLALKAMALAPWKHGEERTYKKPWYKPAPPELAALALRYTLSKEVTAAIPPGEIDYLRLALDTMEGFEPITPDEEAYLISKAEGIEPIFTS